MQLKHKLYDHKSANQINKENISVKFVFRIYKVNNL